MGLSQQGVGLTYTRKCNPSLACQFLDSTEHTVFGWVCPEKPSILQLVLRLSSTTNRMDAPCLVFLKLLGMPEYNVRGEV